MSYIDVTGKTEDEAISKALAQLGLERDDVSVQVLERAKSGFLGLGSQPAKVRVTYGQAEPEPAGDEEEKPAAMAEAPVEKPASPAPEKAAPAAPKPRREDARPPRREKAPRQERPAAAPAPAAPAQDLGDEVDDEKAAAIRAFLSGLLAQMEVAADIHVYQPEKGRYKVILTGAGLGAIIGRRGETLDAIQQLTNYSVNRAGSGRVRIQLDAEHYRERREQSLQSLARKVADKVVRYRRSVTLEPMNAYERHVIHTALQDVPGVSTASIGVDPNRRVVVSYDRDQH